MRMPAVEPKTDVLVVGDHPCAYLAVALLGLNSRIRVAHATVPGERLVDRLVLVNPAFFDIHPLVAPLRRRLRSHPIYGLDFIADDRGRVIGHHRRSCVALVCRLGDIRREMLRKAKATDAVFLDRGDLEIHGLDDSGIDLTIGATRLCARALIVAAELPPKPRRALGIHDEWERGVVHRYTWMELDACTLAGGGSRPNMPMSLDLKGLLRWAWAIPGWRSTLLAVEQPIDTIDREPPEKLLLHWADVLERHGILRMKKPPRPQSIAHADLPLAGALAHEALANRTLLVGPAGGFYSACAEDIYPNCWSAVYAVEIMKRALKAQHLQDGLQPYRQSWRTTLGDYLRGPQQNLRFLLPLVYRNQAMTDRLAQAILTGQGVVR